MAFFFFAPLRCFSAQMCVWTQTGLHGYFHPRFSYLPSFCLSHPPPLLLLLFLLFLVLLRLLSVILIHPTVSRIFSRRLFFSFSETLSSFASAFTLLRLHLNNFLTFLLPIQHQRFFRLTGILPFFRVLLSL